MEKRSLFQSLDEQVFKQINTFKNLEWKVLFNSNAVTSMRKLDLENLVQF